MPANKLEAQEVPQMAGAPPALDAYAPDKAAWHLDRIADMRKGKQAVPVNIQLIISDTCNENCGYCAYRASDGLSSAQFGGLDKQGRPTMNPDRLIPADKVKELLHDARTLGVRSITWTGGGEPTVHLAHLELFEYALNLGFECSLNTNGLVLRPGWSNILPRFTYIRFSFDGSTPEEYAAIRGTVPANFERVRQNMAAVVGAVKDAGSPCVVGAGYVVTPEFAESTAKGVELLRETGVAYVRLAAQQSVDVAKTYGDRFDLARRSSARARELSTPGFRVISLFEEAIGRKMQSPFCGFQQLVLYIGGNVAAFRCCYTAYMPVGKVGDLSKMRLVDWFNSPEKHRAYAEFDARNCTTCPLATKNEAIAALLREPLHANFP